MPLVNWLQVPLLSRIEKIKIGSGRNFPNNTGQKLEESEPILIGIAPAPKIKKTGTSIRRVIWQECAMQNGY